MHYTAVAYSIEQSDLKYIYKRLFLDGTYALIRITLSTTTLGGHGFSQLCHQNVRHPNQQDNLSVITLMTLRSFKKGFLEMLPFLLLGHFSEHGLSVSTTFALNGDILSSP